MPDLLLSASNLRAALLAREFSASDLLDATLAQIRRLNPVLNAIVQRDEAAAWRAAADSDLRLARGEARPLEGLPMTIKDCFEVAGLITDVGAPALRDHVPDQDASAVARLRRAGAVILGKTNVPMLTGDFQTYNGLHGVTQNPWNLDYSPGGSSGGAAVAVATGMSAFELGSDLAGSIRWPAHCCGLFGLKTSWGLVSTFGHIPPVPDQRLQSDPELLVVGPLARSSADLAMVLDVIAGPRDSSQPGPVLPPPRGVEPKGLRVAVWMDEPLAETDKTVAEAVWEAASLLEKEGAIVNPKARPEFSFAEAWEIAAVLIHAHIGIGLSEKIREKLADRSLDLLPGDLSHHTLQVRGMRMDEANLTDLQLRRARLQSAWSRFFESFDVVLCPPASVGAIKHDFIRDLHARRIEVSGRPKPYYDLMLWACLATGAGLPSVVTPVRIAADGLPRAVQILAAAQEDRTAIACAAMLENLGLCFKAPPLARQ